MSGKSPRRAAWKKNAMAVALGVSVFAGFAFSATAATLAQQTRACRNDAIKYCAEHIPNKAKIKACMREHFEKLNPDCQAMFGEPDEGSDGADESAPQKPTRPEKTIPAPD